jgi:hypothetical protein
MTMSTLLASSAKPAKPKVTPVRMVAAALIVAVGIGFVAFAFGGEDAARRDYICYWAAGQELAHHGNPYDGTTILKLEQTTGYPGGRAFFMRNPPTAFAFVLPLGYIGMRTGSILWSLAIICALIISIRLLWILQGSPPDRLFMAAYLFLPVIPCLHQGQTGIFLLLGVVLFLFFRDLAPYLAGAALILPSLKPHLFLPFGVVLIYWIISRRAYRILAGFLSTLLLSVATAYFLDQSGWPQYASMIRTEGISNEFVPTLSLVFRHAINPNATWLQVVPAIAGCIWAAFYFFRNRRGWNWSTNGSLVLLVSVMVAPYAWLPDECVVLPAIVAGLCAASRKSLVLFCVIMAIGFIELAVNLPTNSGAYIWTTSAWLLWYLYATPLAQEGVGGPAST